MVPASFTVDYDCGVGYTGQVNVVPDVPVTVPNIPVGNTCTVTEIAPAVISGYTWGPITYDPASVVVSDKGGTFKITVGNSITRDRRPFQVAQDLEQPRRRHRARELLRRL